MKLITKDHSKYAYIKRLSFIPIWLLSVKYPLDTDVYVKSFAYLPVYLEDIKKTVWLETYYEYCYFFRGSKNNLLYRYKHSNVKNKK